LQATVYGVSTFLDSFRVHAHELGRWAVADHDLRRDLPTADHALFLPDVAHLRAHVLSAACDERKTIDMAAFRGASLRLVPDN
jgi:hypothetical protein